MIEYQKKSGRFIISSDSDQEEFWPIVQQLQAEGYVREIVDTPAWLAKKRDSLRG